MYAMELKYTEREKTAQHEFQGVVDELKNKVNSNTCIVDYYSLVYNYILYRI